MGTSLYTKLVSGCLVSKSSLSLQTGSSHRIETLEFRKIFICVHTLIWGFYSLFWAQGGSEVHLGCRVCVPLRDAVNRIFEEAWCLPRHVVLVCLHCVLGSQSSRIWCFQFTAENRHLNFHTWIITVLARRFILDLHYIFKACRSFELVWTILGLLGIICNMDVIPWGKHVYHVLIPYLRVLQIGFVS